LRNYSGDYMLTPISYGITQLSNANSELFFSCIMKEGKGRTLKSLMAAGIKFDENFILTKLLKPVLDSLNHIHQCGAIHGCINPDNIYIDETGIVTISECISEIAGFSQPPFFETTERAQSQNWGKGRGDEKVDYYALGMTIYALLSGKDFSGYDAKEIVKLKLHQGTFEFLSSNHSLSAKMSDLVRGLAIDDPELRWTYIDIDMLAQGRNYSTQNLVDHSYQSRAIIFNSKEFYSRRALAHEFTQNWDAAKEFIKGDKLKKWLDLSTQDEKFAELFSAFMLNYSALKQGSGQKVFLAEDEKLARVIILLDPHGPIRFKNVSFHKSGLGPLLLHSINSSLSEVTHVLAGSLVANLYSVYEYMDSFMPGLSFGADLMQIHKCADYIRRPELGFGVERCVYELNPTLTCQSHIVKSDFCIGITDTLSYLNERHISFEDMMSKKNLACYLAAKTHTVDNKLKDISQYPAIQKSRAYQFLQIIASAQKACRIGRIDHLVSNIKDALQDVLDINLRSAAIKKEFHESLNNSIKSGSAIDLLKAAMNTDLLEKDYDGYAKALRRGAEIAYEIFSYSNRNTMEYDIRRRSLKLAVKFSYIVSAFILVTILLKSF
jgi:serine/threonine protein kinase